MSPLPPYLSPPGGGGTLYIFGLVFLMESHRHQCCRNDLISTKGRLFFIQVSIPIQELVLHTTDQIAIK